MSLRELIAGSGPVLVGGAYNAISASLVEKAGFDAIWLSSFGVSIAERALPDANLITLSEMLQVGRNMVAAVSIPVIADCENGYGDINNAVHTVREFERAGISAACIDDNQYPKRCSLFDHADRQLVPLPEMVSKIKAVKDAQRSKEFIFIARTETLIADRGFTECVERSCAYLEAGADLIAIHSRSWPDLQHMLAQWEAPDSLVVIPTMFPGVDSQQLRSAGFKVIIYANEAIRASLKATQDVLLKLRHSGRSLDVQTEIMTLDEVHELVRFEDVRNNGAHPRPRS
jgi:phosphoenolpyruvate phosphomutase